MPDPVDSTLSYVRRAIASTHANTYTDGTPVAATHIHTERHSLTPAQFDAVRATHGEPDACAHCEPVADDDPTADTDY